MIGRSKKSVQVEPSKRVGIAVVHWFVTLQVTLDVCTRLRGSALARAVTGEIQRGSVAAKFGFVVSGRPVPGCIVVTLVQCVGAPR